MFFYLVRRPASPFRFSVVCYTFGIAVLAGWDWLAYRQAGIPAGSAGG
jgi:hypothetical protein